MIIRGRSLLPLAALLMLSTTAPGLADANADSSMEVDSFETTCLNSHGRYRLHVFADYHAPSFGLLLQEVRLSEDNKPMGVVRQLLFPETRNEFDGTIHVDTAYCELRGSTLAIYGRDETTGEGDDYLVYRILLNTSAWTYSFATTWPKWRRAMRQ